MDPTTTFDTTLTSPASTQQFTEPVNSSSKEGEFMDISEVRALLQLPDGNTLSSYNDLRTIGVGGFGTVYSAKEPGLERDLALKVLRPRYRDSKDKIHSFIREARITAQIDHPNIVPVHRIGVFDDAGVYFSMKRIAGETLRTVLKKLKENRPGYRKKYTLPRLLDIFIGACQGVRYAHQNGILHCDLKPENIMVGGFGEVLVMDWGMARRLPGTEKSENASGKPAGEFMGGTPVFMAPEHLSLSSGEHSIRSDIYALGCVLYAILTWKTSPFEGAETLKEIQKKVVQEKVPPPRRCAPPSQIVPRELESICLKAMARFPEKRYESVSALIEDLRNFRDGLPVNAYNTSPVYKLGKFCFRHPLIPATIFFALLVWCGFSLYTVFSDHLYAESLKISAANNFHNGNNSIQQARKRIIQPNRDTMTFARMQAIENAIASDAANAEADFKTALDILARIPAEHRVSGRVSFTAKQIFRSLSEFYHLTGNDEKLHNLAVLFNERWNGLYNDARKNDPAFRKLFNEALSGIGTVRLINAGEFKGSCHIEDSNGTIVKTLTASGKDQDQAESAEALQLQLPLGFYTIVIKRPDGSIHRIPLRSSLTYVNKADLTLPAAFPRDMVFIPGGEFSHSPELSNNFRRRSFEDNFLIKRTEVTVAEYLEFWKSLKDPEQKKLFASYFFSSRDSMQSTPSWDDEGRLLRPGLLPDHPVTGISAYAADAFCRYKSEKLKRHVSLPSRAQWSKAAGGIDGTEYVWGDTYKEGAAIINTPKLQQVGTTPGDSSIYGVLDLSGNVREFVKLPEKNSGIKGNYAIAGGSFFSHPAVARNSNIVYSSRGGNDVGFRYVMTVEKTKSSPAVKK